MNNKKSKVFLYVSLVCFLLTIVGVIIATIWEYYQVQEAFANDPRRIKEEISWLKICLIIFIVPVLAAGLSGIRSTYKLLKHNPKGIVKICYLISAIISFLACIWQTLTCLGVTDLVIPISNIKTQELILFLPGLPTFIVSFILGSISIKHGG